MEAALDYELSAIQKLRYCHKILDGETKRYYRSYVQYINITFEEARARIQIEYSSIARQKRVKSVYKTSHYPLKWKKNLLIFQKLMNTLAKL